MLYLSKLRISRGNREQRRQESRGKITVELAGAASRSGVIYLSRRGATGGGEELLPYTEPRSQFLGNWYRVCAVLVPHSGDLGTLHGDAPHTVYGASTEAVHVPPQRAGERYSRTMRKRG